MLADARMTFIERQAALTAVTLAGFFAANFLAVVFAVLLPVDSLSGEIQSGVIQTLASKPIRRSDIVLGKWAGHWLLAVAYLTLLTGGIIVSVRTIAGLAPLNPWRVIALMALEVTLLMTVSIAGGARLSTVTNGIAALGFYGVGFIGGLVEQIGGLSGIESMRTVGIVTSLISPSDAMWRLAAYYLQPAILRGLSGPLFASATVPSALMIWWALGYTALALAYGVRSFSRRAL
jgi:ABC-type transport system involved in multi-copper enzyme maturation permease subunit